MTEGQMTAGEIEIYQGELLPETPIRSTELEHVEDPATTAVLAAMEQAADEHLDDIRPQKTRKGYERDWALWGEYHEWLATKTGHLLPLTAVTKGTLVGFVAWLDQVKEAAPNSIDRRITGVTVEARRRGVTIPKEATVAARKALKPIRLDSARQARGRGKAVAATPENLHRMSSTTATSDLAAVRNRALTAMAFGIGGRASEVGALTADAITLESEGLRVKVPSVKGRPGRTVVVAYGERSTTCPVRTWLAWKEAAGITTGPAFLPIDRWGNLGEGHLSADACRLIITRIAAAAGLDAKLTGHSMRAGLVTTARKRKKRVEKIREQTGHAPNSPVFWEYIRDGELWEDAATDGIGL